MTDTDTMPGTGAGTTGVGRATPSSESPPSNDFDALKALVESFTDDPGDIPDCDDIVDLTEIATRAGTTPGTVRSWRYRHPEFPQPVARLAVGPVWRWADVEPWLATRRKR
jgi:hypothetical protein